MKGFPHVFLAVLVTVCACETDLSRAEATEALDSHFTSVFPKVSDEHPVTASVSTILMPDEATREVILRIHFSRPDSLGSMQPDSSGAVSSFFQRSDEGWTLLRYSPPMSEMMAGLLGSEWQRDYVDLTEVLDSASGVIRDWELDTSRRSIRIMEAGDVMRGIEVQDRAMNGPTSTQVDALLDSAGVQVPANMEMGFVEDEFGARRPVLWVRDLRNKRICAEAVGMRSDFRPPIEFLWLGEYGVTTCRGARQRVDYLSARDSARQYIEALGGIIR